MKAIQRSWTLVLVAALQLLFIMIGVIAVVVFFASYLSAEAHAGPYAQFGGGCIWSDQQSNSDELEFGSECGGLVAAEGGHVWDLSLANLSVGLEAAHRFKALHGQNGHGKATADGNTLHATSLAINGRAEAEIWGPVGVYLMAGAGAAVLHGLDDEDFTPLVQTEGGLLFTITENITAGGGYRAAWLPSVDLDGNQGDLSFHGAVGWLRWSFE